jgi:hypothetical protein
VDDNTTITVFRPDSLQQLRKILENFGAICGLHCNYDKTVILPVGSAKPQMGMACEFKIVDRLTLLGMEIRKNLDNVDDIFVRTGEKINKLILFWSRFRLSLRGRISVMKTFLLPQLNYLGCFLTSGPDLLYGIQELIDSFVIGNLQPAR